MDKKKRLGLYAASALIPCGIYLITLLVLGAVPFGDSSLIISDAKNQYLDFASYWRTVLLGENDLFYTFSKTMGGDMLNLAAYYLLSPVNLLFLLATETTLPAVYTGVMVVKIALCGLAYFHASCCLYGCRKDHLLFSSCYSLMGYTTLFGWNIMWMDGVMVLPLLILGIYRLMEGKAPWLYIGCLAYSLATNFYIGYMLCIGAVLCFCALTVLKWKGWNALLGRTGSFACASLAGGFGAGIVWLPTFLSIAGERSQTNGFTVTLARNPNLLSFPAKFLSGSASVQEVASGLPHVFCGAAVLVLVAAFFLSRKNTFAQKLMAGGLILFFLLSFAFALPSTIWHGFSPANSFNFRYSFLFTFLLIVLAQYQFQRRDALSSRAVIAGAAVVGCIFLFALVRRAPFVQLPGAAVSIFVLMASAFCLLPRNRSGRWQSSLLILVCLLELGVNCLLSWNVVADESWRLDASDYQETVARIDAAVDYVKDRDDGFYRMEKTFWRGNNDSALFGYNGLSHFSSTEPVFVKPFMRSLGYATHHDFWAAYTTGSTAEADALLGVRYLLTRDDCPRTASYNLLTTINGIAVYENPFALSPAILSEAGVLDLSSDTGDPVSFHNAIWQAMTGIHQPLLLPQDYTLTLQNLTAEPKDNGTTDYRKTDPSQDAWLRYEVTVGETLPLYYHLSGKSRDRAEVFVNGEPRGLYFDDFSWNMTCAGTFAPGETVVIEFHPVGEELNVLSPSFFCEDTAALPEAARLLQAREPQLIRERSSRLSGSFTAQENQVLLFTIPYSDGWQLRIDGEPVPCEMVLDGFLGATVPAGEHTFTLRYLPKGFALGCGLTALSVSMCLVWFLLRKRSRR